MTTFQTAFVRHLKELTMTPTLIILGVLFVICLIIWMIYNGIIGNNNQTKRAWADVLVYERQKIKTLDALKACLLYTSDAADE